LLRGFERDASHQAVDLVTLLEEQLGKVDAVLPCDSGN
jgi:hypothetical protein